MFYCLIENYIQTKFKWDQREEYRKSFEFCYSLWGKLGFKLG